MYVVYLSLSLYIYIYVYHVDYVDIYTARVLPMKTGAWSL